MPTLVDWQNKGFAEPPRHVVARGDEILYRCFGGYVSGAVGKWFAPLKCQSVSEAELKYNVAIHGDKLSFVATCRVRAGTEMWVGRVAHGARDHADRAAVQIYVERPYGQVELVHDVESLKQDLFASRHTGHA